MARKYCRRKLETYQGLASINQCFYVLTHHVQELGNTGLLPGPQMPTFQGLLRELQSQISHFIVERLHQLEHKDMFEHGKVRIERDHYLNENRPGFHKPQPENPPQPETPISS